LFAPFSRVLFGAVVTPCLTFCFVGSSYFQDGRPYYHNLFTREVTWKPPDTSLDSLDSYPDLDARDVCLALRERGLGDFEAAEPASKRRLVGEQSPPSIRHLGFVLQTPAACLMFCFEQLCEKNKLADGNAGFSLAALPQESLEVICRMMVVGRAVVRFSSPETLECVATLHARQGRFVSTLETFTAADGTQYLAAGGECGVVNLWNLATRECFASLETGIATCMAFFSSGDDGRPLLASASTDYAIVLWDIRSRSQLARLSGHTREVRSLVVYRGAAGFDCLASGSSDGTVRLWDLRAQIAIATLQSDSQDDVDSQDANSLCVFRDAAGVDVLASGGRDSVIRVWDLETLTIRFSFGGLGCTVSSLTCFTRKDGVPMLVSADSEKTVVWDVNLREAVFVITGSRSNLACVAGGDGRVVLASLTGVPTNVNKQKVVLFDLSSNEPVFETLLGAWQLPARFLNQLAPFYDYSRAAPFFAITNTGKETGIAEIQIWTPARNFH
jgi:WD domain, G-beta repeat